MSFFLSTDSLVLDIPTENKSWDIFTTSIILMLAFYSLLILFLIYGMKGPNGNNSINNGTTIDATPHWSLSIKIESNVNQLR